MNILEVAFYVSRNLYELAVQLPPPLADKRLVLFDLDGVLVDTRANMLAAWSAVRRELGIDVPFDAYIAEIGQPFGSIMRRLGIGHLSDSAEIIYRQRSARDLASAPVYANIAIMLDGLYAAGRLLGIVTSKDSERTAILLERLPPVFSIVRCPDSVCRGKPAPDHLMMAMALTRCDPCETLYVGDMASDAEAARRAGIDFLHAAWGYGERPPGTSLQVTHPEQIAQLLLPEKVECVG